MRYLFLFFVCLFFACSAPITDEKDPEVLPEKLKDRIEQEQSILDNKVHTEQKLKQQQKCEIKGEVLEKNQLWLKDQGKLICITADSSTYDKTLGMSHRTLKLYNTKTCELELKLTLPVNISPDFPYFLADINYNNTSKIVAIKAAKTVYCFDLMTKKMLPLLTPAFKVERADVDASSGTIIRLELWENFLVGFAQDKGTFVFDLGYSNIAKPILPFAEFPLGANNFNSLFLLPTDSNKYQAILPSFDWEEEIFSINPLFNSPIALNKDIQKSALDNPFIVLREKLTNHAVLINMKKLKRSSLPEPLVNKSTKEILEWAKGK